MVYRRDVLKSMVGAAGLFAMPSLLPANPPRGGVHAGRLRRVIFFMQEHGFDPYTCIPKGLTESCDLSTFKFAEHMAPLEVIKDKMHVVMGLHGTHTSPTHSAGFGALGGFRGGMGLPPSAPTIDHVLSQCLPQTIMPHFTVGMDSLDRMRSRPSFGGLSASGAAKPIYMQSDPNRLYQDVFGSVAEGKVSQIYQSKTAALARVEKLLNGRFSSSDSALVKDQLASYVDEFGHVNDLRNRLASIPDILNKHKPAYSDAFVYPEFETDWHHALLDISIAVMRSNLSNVLTIGCGRGEIYGSYFGIGLERSGHGLGHTVQSRSGNWVKVRQYNCQMLLKLVEALEAEAEPGGPGTMMDNTLIVYSSNNADTQHTEGKEWPFVFIGNGGGTIRTQRFTQVAGDRPINDLYTTLLRAAGQPADGFNMNPGLAQATNSLPGPIEELLA